MSDVTETWLELLRQASSIGEPETVAAAETLVLQSIFATFTSIPPSIRATDDKIRSALAAMWRLHDDKHRYISRNFLRATTVVNLVKSGHSLNDAYATVADMEEIDQDSVKESIRRARKANPHFRTFTINTDTLRVTSSDPFSELPKKAGRPRRN